MSKEQITSALQEMVTSGAADEITRAVLLDALENILTELDKLSKELELKDYRLKNFSHNIDNGLAISLAARYFTPPSECEYLDEADEKLAGYLLQEGLYKLMAEIKKGINL